MSEDWSLERLEEFKKEFVAAHSSCGCLRDEFYFNKLYELNTLIDKKKMIIKKT